MKLFHYDTADQSNECIELNDQDLAQVSGGHDTGYGDDERDRDKCYYDKKRHRRYCYDRHGHRYEPHH
ncbi:hypothetical protein [Dictyobacter kobayashii]|uniref:Uncharacterized protein n=1 Tax=Dictyobacter kobayashii TaxID=2014872 RepID=A0A402APX5_9CHLR|nr:hypothetical protein [Dictyobacter kobayashii]GCE21104.1 hypothetical protein KDK_49040 [Dictyobacter kobayashii]